MQRKTITIIALGAAAAIGWAIPASAHVTAQPPEQPAGGFTVVTMRVPNERPEPTNKLEVQFPDGIASARTKPVPGWTVEIEMEDLDEPVEDGHGGEITQQVASITWSGGSIAENEFEEFPVSVKMVEEGELGDQVFFPAIQTYAGGEVVGWTEKPASEDSDAELERPAPSVTLVAGDDHHGGAEAEGADDDHGDDEAASDDADEEDGEVDPGVALGVGILGVVLAAFALFTAMRGKRD